MTLGKLADVLTSARAGAASDTAFLLAVVTGTYGAVARRIANDVAYEIEIGPDPDQVGADEAADLMIERVKQCETEEP